MCGLATELAEDGIEGYAVLVYSEAGDDLGIEVVEDGEPRGDSPEASQTKATWKPALNRPSQKRWDGCW
jgi:hypothetical protein